jgi:hypothetical protein
MRLVLFWFVGIAAVLFYPVSVWGSAIAVRSFVAAGVLSFVNVVLGYLAIEYAFQKPNITFLKVILGSMLVRLLLLGLAVAVLLEVFRFPALALLLSLMLFYGLNLILEIYYLQKKVTLKQQ